MHMICTRHAYDMHTVRAQKCHTPIQSSLKTQLSCKAYIHAQAHAKARDQRRICLQACYAAVIKPDVHAMLMPIHHAMLP